MGNPAFSSTALENRPAAGSRDTEAVLLLDEGTRWVRMAAPLATLVARSPADVVDLIREAETAARRGLFAVGWLAYEAGEAFETNSPQVPGAWSGEPDGAPSALFMLYRPEGLEDVTPPAAGALRYSVSPPQPSWDWPAYSAAFRHARERIASGDTYQVNATFDLHAAIAGDPRGLFFDLARAQRGRYAAYLRTGRWSVCSASPELFFLRRGTRLVARPMKGTAPRGRTLAEDRAAADRLVASAKERAENVMIVDMMRNDLGRIARIGSVRVPRLFSAERYPTVWQMTSEVTADSGAPLDEIFGALFPCASVTGAPKVRTMEIIRALEGRPRGIYTGAIGCLAPGGDAQFSVAIRTAVVDHDREALTFGVGSGIVWDSDPESEYRECLLKGAVLGRGHVPFELLETLKWTPPGGYALLPEHLERLRGSAEYFDYPCEPAELSRALAGAVAGAGSPRRVRLMVDPAGRARTEVFPLDDECGVVRACIAPGPIDAADVFLFHKTTRRAMYDAQRCPHCEDVILWNARGEITESTTANVVVELDGRLVTPPVASGLLAGTFRARLIREGRVTERVLGRGDLARASRLWLVNSVRGWRQVNLREH